MTPTATLSVADSIAFGAAALVISILVPHPIEHVETLLDVALKGWDFLTKVGGGLLVAAGWWRFHHPHPVKRNKRRRRPHVVVRIWRAVRDT